jgi:hypothetical protein
MLHLALSFLYAASGGGYKDWRLTETREIAPYMWIRRDDER